jgi:hypothetical protein
MAGADMDGTSFTPQEMGRNRSVDVREDIAKLFGDLILCEAQISQFAASKSEDATIVNLFIANFYPTWITFYGVTKLGFTQTYLNEKQNEKLRVIIQKSDEEIKKYRVQKPLIQDVWNTIDKFNEYMPFVVDKSMITITGD